MGVALVVVASDLRQLAHLFGVQQAIGYGDAQHGRIALDIETVLQAQRAVFLTAELSGQEAAGLVAKLGDTFFDDPLIVLIVNVHGHPAVRRRARLRVIEVLGTRRVLWRLF